ncbi:MAG: 6-carboxytetrahydropterin synthase [Bdellovibrionaceae bacterium]|nr:6-carboxytetrahydropterin synthase [Pseudobdellovibrionaceae bacterium]
MLVTERFSAAHLYHQPKWGKKQNQEKFGKCFTEFGHGHNYRVEAAFTENAGPLEDLEQALRLVVGLLDHQHLNFVIPEFKTAIPTTENIALFCLEKLKMASPSGEVVSLRLYEMDDLWVEVTSA